MFNMITAEMNEIVIAEQLKQLEKPTRACVNSESAFVAERIRNAGHIELSKQYWNFVCGGKNPGFNDEVQKNAKKLKDIDRGFTMPEWGTYGT